jgi:nitronate monooxygenase
MRQFLQARFYADRLSTVPEPQGTRSDVSPEHLSMLLEAEPEVVSFHFGLPAPEILQAIKSAGIFVLSSATTVAEARLLEEGGVDAVIAQGTEAGGIARLSPASTWADNQACSRFCRRSLTPCAFR